jgi:hypothetical protein
MDAQLLTSGAVVHTTGSTIDIWVVRCPAARPDFVHLQGKVPGRSTYATRVARLVVDRRADDGIRWRLHLHSTQHVDRLGRKTEVSHHRNA